MLYRYYNAPFRKDTTPVSFCTFFFLLRVYEALLALLVSDLLHLVIVCEIRVNSPFFECHGGPFCWLRVQIWHNLWLMYTESGNQGL